jgi:hypothetical protein
MPDRHHCTWLAAGLARKVGRQRVLLSFNLFRFSLLPPSPSLSLSLSLSLSYLCSCAAADNPKYRSPSGERGTAAAAAESIVCVDSGAAASSAGLPRSAACMARAPTAAASPVVKQCMRRPSHSQQSAKETQAGESSHKKRIKTPTDSQDL